jgi:hypothetical protein
MSLVETYWEGSQAEVVSPELALVDPVLRERLLSQSRPGRKGNAEPATDPIDEPPVSTPTVPDSTPSEAELGRGPTRRGRVIAWTSVTASCAAAFAIVALAYAQHPSGTHAPPASPAVAVVTTYTPPPTVTPPAATTTVDQRSEADKIRLQVLLRSPMRDPFARTSG